MDCRRYIGKSVEIIYIDRLNRCTQRTVTVHRVRDHLMYGYDHAKRGYRTFRTSRILALLPVSA